ncbi:MAG: O-antigen ligase family protein [Flavobacteriales bacterium]|nr:O-antigen ligase family protein [Flavobacteriales bacterium]MCB9168239.1 O-antigen ligase family protein [Flavobacteriales bacterium]
MLRKREAEDVAAAAVAVAIPLWPAAVPVLLIALVLAVAWGHFRSGAGLCHPSWSTSLPWMAGFYILHVIGLGWSSNMDLGMFDLQVKLPLLVFPVLLWLGARSSFDPAPVSVTFVRACVLAVVVDLVRSTWTIGSMALARNGPLPSAYTLSKALFGEGFSPHLHPSYFAMYLTFALGLVAFGTAFRGWGGRTRWGLALVLVIGVVLSASKAGWILALALGVGVLIVHRNERRWRRWGGLAIIAGGLVSALSYARVEFVHERIAQVLGTVHEAGPDPHASNSTDLRRLVWQAAEQLVRAHPIIGVGTGDVKDALQQVYVERDYTGAAERHLNAHSQYLNSWVALGLAAPLLLLFSCWIPLIVAFRRRESVAGIFFLLNGLNWTVEAMLEVQAGVVFFAFFSWLLVLDRSHGDRSANFAAHDPVQPSPHR